MRVVSVGHALFAIAVIALGILGLIRSDYAVLWHPVPIAVVGHRTLGYVCALLAPFCGIGLLWRRAVAFSSRVLLAYLVVCLLLVSLPGIFSAHAAFGSWYGIAEPAVMVAAAWVLYAWFASDWDRCHLCFATGADGIRIARVLFALTLLYFGIGHIVFLKETASDVPDWLPWHVAWAYLTGLAFIAAGLALLFGWFARLAAALSTLQICLFVLLVWIPKMIAGSQSAFTLRETIISAALATGAWVMADSYRGQPWLALNR